MKRTLILPAVLLVILIQHSVRADRAIYVNMTGNGPTALSDVFEMDLVTGRTRVIIAHDSVPKSFQTRIERVTPSPGGAYLLIRASGAYDLVYKDGKRERQYGSEFMVPEGAKTRRIAPSYWVWSFTARKMTQVTDTIWSDDVFWAPDGRHLLVVNRPEYVGRPERLVNPRLLRSYDPATGTTSVRLKLPDRGEPIWSDVVG